MTTRNTALWLTSAVLVLTISLVRPLLAFAHCDALDGPVVSAARAALEQRNPALVLIWVQVTDEPEIRSAFEQTLAVRMLNPQARDLADRYFFETVVRVHRAGEGEPYTGLKPAGRDLGPSIPAADKAIEDGSLSRVTELLTQTLQARLRERFNEVVAARAFKAGDVAAGREYVKAYVEFIHYVERVFDAAAGHDTSRASSK
jgi:hypothetical protein